MIKHAKILESICCWNRNHTWPLGLQSPRDMYGQFMTHSLLSTFDKSCGRFIDHSLEATLISEWVEWMQCCRMDIITFLKLFCLFHGLNVSSSGFIATYRSTCLCTRMRPTVGMEEYYWNKKLYDGKESISPVLSIQIILLLLWKIPRDLTIFSENEAIQLNQKDLRLSWTIKNIIEGFLTRGWMWEVT